MKKVNLFVVGAPKCGTTALCSYLSEHENICLSRIKEPHYFAHEFSYFKQVVDNLDDYHNLFYSSNDNTIVYMEGSVYYLYARKAIQSIFEYNPRAKFVVMLRNPVEMVQSLHSQLVWTTDEDIADFETAWQFQEKRAGGEGIPENCREPLFLQYGKLCSLGEQVKRMTDIVEKENIKFIEYSDFKKNTKDVYESILGFAGVVSENKTDFKIINANKIHKFRGLAKFTERPPGSLVKLNNKIKNIFGINETGIMNLIRKYTAETRSRKELDEKIKNELYRYFEEDVKVLSDILGEDFLRKWGFC